MNRCLLVGLLWCWVSWASATPATIEKLVGDLGAADFKTRESATAALRQVGFAAIEPLEKAAASTDPEVRERAREILAELRLGITPDWPADLADLAREAGQLPGDGATVVIRRLSSELKERAVPFLLAQLRQDATPQMDADSAARDRQRTAVLGKIEAAADDEADRELTDQLQQYAAPRADAALQALRDLDSYAAADAVLRWLKQPRKSHEYIALAWALNRRGRTIEGLRLIAGKHLDSAGVAEQVSVRALKELQTRLEDDDYRSVAEIAGQLVESAPTEARFLYVLAAAKEGLGQRAEADALRQRALALHPRSAARHYVVASMLNDFGWLDPAVLEWEKLLGSARAGGGYDDNAHFGLSKAQERLEHWQPAADHLRIAIEMIDREHGNGGGVIGASREELGKLLQVLQRRAAEQTSGNPTLQITVHLNHGKLKEWRAAIHKAELTFPVTVQPHDFRLFEAAGTSLRYDRQQQQIIVSLNRKPCMDPVAILLREGHPHVAVNQLNCTYIYEVDTATGAMQQIARFEKTYTLTLKPGRKAAALTHIKATLNGEECDWPAWLKGVELDYLPEKFELDLTGQTATGTNEHLHTTLELREPGEFTENGSSE